jgi:hypothetical protein
MKRLALSSAAAGLIRALLARVGRDRDRILLTDVTSTDWRSLTFTGERHVIVLRVSGPDGKAVADQLTGGLAGAEFALSQCIVADIAVESIRDQENGSVLVTIEALTICA